MPGNDSGRHRRPRRYAVPVRIVLSVAVLAIGALAAKELVRPSPTQGAWSPPGTSAAALPPVASPSALPPSAESPSAESPSAVSVPITFPERGDRTWATASGRGSVAGSGGRLLRYRTAVEGGIDHLTPAQFAGRVERILSDPRSWTGTGKVRLQRVGAAEPADFTIYLSTPVTRDRLCGHGRDRYTSCRSGDRVVINVARWVNGAAAFDADLDTYRIYLINHEVGHRLGHPHQLCPGPGRPAPVMQQQTLGLHGCRPQPWPVSAGKIYAGRIGSYDDPVPNA